MSSFRLPVIFGDLYISWILELFSKEPRHHSVLIDAIHTRAYLDKTWIPVNVSHTTARWTKVFIKETNTYCFTMNPSHNASSLPCVTFFWDMYWFPISVKMIQLAVLGCFLFELIYGKQRSCKRRPKSFKILLFEDDDQLRIATLCGNGRRGAIDWRTSYSLTQLCVSKLRLTFLWLLNSVQKLSPVYQRPGTSPHT